MRQLSRKFSRRLWRNAKVSSTDIHATYGSLFYQIAARKARHPKIVSNEGLQWRPSPVHLRISGIFLPLCTAIYAVCQGWRLIMSCLSLVGSVPCAVYWLQLESKSNTQEFRHDCSGIGARRLCEWAARSRSGWRVDRRRHRRTYRRLGRPNCWRCRRRRSDWRRSRRDYCRCHEAGLVLLSAAPSPPLRAMLTHRSVFVASRMLLCNATMRVRHSERD